MKKSLRVFALVLTLSLLLSTLAGCNFDIPGIHTPTESRTEANSLTEEEKETRYKQAMSYLNVAFLDNNASYYTKARDLLKEVGDYKDSKAQLKTVEEIVNDSRFADYEKAVNLLKEGKYSEAGALFEKLGGFLHTADYLEILTKEHGYKPGSGSESKEDSKEEGEDTTAQELYGLALDVEMQMTLNNDPATDYEKLENLLSQCGDYSNSQAWLKEVRDIMADKRFSTYCGGVNCWQNGDYEGAYNLLKDLGDFAKTQEYIDMYNSMSAPTVREKYEYYAAYLEAFELYKSGKYDKAKKAFEAVKADAGFAYRDCDAYIAACNAKTPYTGPNKVNLPIAYSDSYTSTMKETLTENYSVNGKSLTVGVAKNGSQNVNGTDCWGVIVNGRYINYASGYGSEFYCHVEGKYLVMLWIPYSGPVVPGSQLVAVALLFDENGNVADLKQAEVAQGDIGSLALLDMQETVPFGNLNSDQNWFVYGPYKYEYDKDKGEDVLKLDFSNPKETFPGCDDEDHKMHSWYPYVFAGPYANDKGVYIYYLPVSPDNLSSGNEYYISRARVMMVSGKLRITNNGLLVFPVVKTFS